jgi:hypothetical protein
VVSTENPLVVLMVVLAIMVVICMSDGSDNTNFDVCSPLEEARIFLSCHRHEVQMLNKVFDKVLHSCLPSFFHSQIKVECQALMLCGALRE